jgi:hypothetical protein
VGIDMNDFTVVDSVTNEDVVQALKLIKENAELKEQIKELETRVFNLEEEITHPYE